MTTTGRSQLLRTEHLQILSLLLLPSRRSHRTRHSCFLPRRQLPDHSWLRLRLRLSRLQPNINHAIKIVFACTSRS
jgi:hypothetical protein